MKKNYLLKYIVFVLLLAVSMLMVGVSENVCAASAERSTVTSSGIVDGNQKTMSEQLPSTIYPMTENLHYRDDVTFTLFVDNTNGFQLCINGAIVHASYYERTAVVYDYDTGRLKVIITFNDVYKYVDDGENQTLFEAYTLNSLGTGYVKTGLTIQWIQGTRLPDAPENLWLEYNNSNLPEVGVLLHGATSGMEFRSQAQLEGWQDLVEGAYFKLPEENSYIYVRYKEPQSKSVKLLVKATPAAPNAKISDDGEFSGINTTHEYKLNDGSYQSVTEEFINAGANSVIDSIPVNETYTFTFRSRGSVDSPVGAEQTLVVYPRAPQPTGVTYNPETGILSGTNTSMEYRVKGTTKWTNCTTSTINMEQYMSATEDVIIELRAKSVENVCFPSKTIEFTLPKLVAAPVLLINYQNETITGFVDGVQYEWATSTSSSAMEDVVLTNGGLDVSDVISSSSSKNVYVRVKATENSLYSNKVQITLPKRPSSPSTPAFVANDPNNPEKIVLTGLDATMEYKKSTDEQWTRCITANNIVFDIPAEDETYYIRYVAQNNVSFASVNRSRTLTARNAAPSLTYNNVTENLTLKTSQEIKFDDQTQFYEITSDSTTRNLSSIIDAIPAGSTRSLFVRTKATASDPASEIAEHIMYSRAAAPTGVSYDPVTMTVSGVSTQMYHQLVGVDTAWTKFSGTTYNMQSRLSDTVDQKLLVRLGATDTNSASQIVELNIPKRAASPVLSIDFEKETIKGFEAGSAYQYNTNNSATSWTNITLTADNEFDVSGLISTTANKNVYIRKAATSTEPPTAAVHLVLPKRDAAPSTPAFVANDANNPEKIVLTGLAVGMEYKKSTDTQWTKCTSSLNVAFDIPAANETYYVRYYAYPNSLFGSANKSLTLRARASAPSITYSNITEIFTLKTTLEMRFDDQPNFYAVSEDSLSLNVSGIIDTIPAGSTRSVYFRTAATSTYPASEVKEHILYPRAATPTTVVYDPITMKVSGVNTQMYHMLVGTATSWTKFTATTYSLESKLSDTDDQVFKVRLGATSTNSASLPVDVIIPKRPTAPSTLTVDYTNEVVKGFESGKAYQYNTSGSVTSWTNMTMNSNNEFDISGILSTSSDKNLYIRRAATSTDPATAAVHIVLPERPSAPSSSVVKADAANADHPEKIVIVGLDSTMEYKVSTDDTWTRCDGSGNLVLDIPTANVTYRVRYYSPNAATPNSANRSVVVYKRGSAPSVTYSSSTEKITKLTTSMEYRLEGETTYTGVTATSMIVSEIIDTIPAGETKTMYIRTKANGVNPASLDREIVLSARS